MTATLENPVSLYSLKRQLEKAVEAVTHYAFANPELKAKHSVAGFFSGPLDDIRYFYANSANWKSFEKNVTKAFKAEPSLAEHPIFISALDNARALYVQVETAVAADKARLAAKRQSIADRAAKKAELGTDLAKVEFATPATYKTLREALEPVRVSVEARYLQQLNERHIELKKAAGDDYTKAFQVMKYGRMQAEIPADFFFFFETTGTDYTQLEDRLNLPALIAAKAKRLATDEVCSFAAKLAGKIDREAGGKKLVSAKVGRASGYYLWHSSQLIATLDDNSTQTWNTKIIWNRSCLGTNFNQWPTTRA